MHENNILKVENPTVYNVVETEWYTGGSDNEQSLVELEFQSYNLQSVLFTGIHINVYGHRLIKYKSQSKLSHIYLTL